MRATENKFAPTDDQRAAFEGAARKRGHADLSRVPVSGCYRDDAVQDAWRMTLAVLAVSVPQLSAPSVTSDTYKTGFLPWSQRLPAYSSMEVVADAMQAELNDLRPAVATLNERLARKDEVLNTTVDAALMMPDPVREQLVEALKIGRDVMALVGTQDHLIDYDAVSKGRKVVADALVAAGVAP